MDENEEKRDTAATDPLNTYLQVGFFKKNHNRVFQVGDWIAQWDAPYEAWYFYNSNTGTPSDPRLNKDLIVQFRGVHLGQT